MDILVDTSCLIEYLRASDKPQTHFAKHFLIHECFISSITLFELWAGATNQNKQNDVNTLKISLKIIDFTEIIAEKSGLIFQELKQKHQNIGNNDIYIASTAIVYNLPLLTNNQRHFQKIEKPYFIVNMNTLHQFPFRQFSQKISLLSPTQQEELFSFLEYLLQKNEKNPVKQKKVLPHVSIWGNEDVTYLEDIKKNDNVIENW